MKVIRSPFSHNVTYAFTLGELQDPDSIFSLSPKEGETVKIQVDCPAESNIMNQYCIQKLTDKGILDAFKRSGMATVSLQRIHKISSCFWMQTVNSDEAVNVQTRSGSILETPKKVTARRASSWGFGSQAPVDGDVHVSNPMKR